jgi:hypothetical protein
VPYRVSWTEPDVVLTLTLTDDVTVEEFVQIGQTVNEQLDARDTFDPIVMIVDATEARSVPREFQRVKESQVYLRRRDVSWLLIVTETKLMRLLMTLTFNLSNPILRLFEDMESAQKFTSQLQRLRE